VLLTVIGVLGYNFNLTLPLFVEQGLGLGDGAFTLAYAVFSAGALVSALVVASRRLVRLRHVLIGAGSLGVAMLLMAVAPLYAVLLPIVFVVGLTSILYMTSSTTLVQVEADHAMHGRLLALQTVLLVGTAPIGGPLLGGIADLFGARAPLVVGGVACLGAAAWGVVAHRRADQVDQPGARAARAATPA
jgi:MFS family permease